MTEMILRQEYLKRLGIRGEKYLVRPGQYPQICRVGSSPRAIPIPVEAGIYS